MGWFPEKITSDIDAVILGMHAHQDNPELAKAKELGLKIYSYPEFLYEQSKIKPEWLLRVHMEKQPLLQ
jgi:UDP-N-acetylmuramate: L-alanyl-gamma-D-glutamyl-meso-diaminopimelate ligase